MTIKSSLASKDSNTAAICTAERICREWDTALGQHSVEGALGLYAPDATLESPLVRHLMGGDQGVIRGRDQLQAFVEKVFMRQPALRRRAKKNFFTDGKTIVWEYPRATAEGDQMDLF